MVPMLTPGQADVCQPNPVFYLIVRFVRRRTCRFKGGTYPDFPPLPFCRGRPARSVGARL
jgi:hypothetical protein